MNTTTPLEEALALALKLAPKERLQLIEQVASSVERDMEDSAEKQPEEHWGKSLKQLMDEIGPIEFVDPEIEDPVEWVKAQRAKRRRRRLGDWGEDNSEDKDE